MKFFPTHLYQDQLPSRVRVLVLGGGVHGAGVLHDMLTRGWKDCLLVEKNNLASGTSSKSTKLIHGGLRYLKNPKDYFMVRQALLERKLLLEISPDLVKPIELCFPIKKSIGMPSWMIQTGLCLYDMLAGKRGIQHYRSLSTSEAKDKIPILETEQISKIFSFWDAQTDDVALVERIANSARQLGGLISEKTEIIRLQKDKDGWLATLKKQDGALFQVSALYVLNCMGPWANIFLEQNHFEPGYQAINSKGSHLVLPDLGLKAGLFLQTQKDARIFFLLPWKQKTLLGTTEELYTGDLDAVNASEEEISYLLTHANTYLKPKLTINDVESRFAGLRWLTQQGKTPGASSREFSLYEHANGPGILMTIYGGKLTSYRSLCEKIGDRLTTHFGQSVQTGTNKKENWFALSEELRKRPISERF